MIESFKTNILPKVEEYLQAKRLRDALVLLKATSEQAGTRTITESLDKIEETYSALLGYLTRGAADPGRDEMYASLVGEAYRALDRLARHIFSLNTPSLYYDALRYRRAKRGQIPSLAANLDEYRKSLEDTSLFNLITEETSAGTDAVKRREVLEDEIFDYIWTVYPLDGDDAEQVGMALADESLPTDFKALILSAVSLGLLEFFDENRVMLLASMVENANMTLSTRALTGLVLGLHKYRTRPLSKKVRDRMALLKETPYWDENLRTMQLELIRARDTERITKKMRDEVIPEVMKHSSDFMNKMKDAESDDDLMLPEENPEWEKLVENSSLRKRLEELTELQMEGSDVMMSTFSNLKTNPFFRKVSHWFLTFNPERSELADVSAGGLSDFASLVSNAPMLCDSDKYSFLFAISDIPESQRRMVASQLSAHSDQLAQLAASDTAPVSRRRSINNYLHDIYRFYKLYRRKREFYDPFAEPVSLFDVKILSDSFREEEPVRLVAELYFRFHDYAQALSAFTAYLDFAPPSAQIFQKIGYCREKLSQYPEAMEAYRQAELFNADNEWTIRRMAAVSKITGDFNDAIKYYSRLSEMLPQDFSVALNLGNTLAAAGHFDDAISQYFKVTFLDERSAKPLRPLAWCLFVTRDFDRSELYYEKVMQNSPTSDDHLNLGHLRLAQGNISGALDSYRRAMNDSGWTFETFAGKMKEDTPFLVKAGIDESILPIVADAVYYSI